MTYPALKRWLVRVTTEAFLKSIRGNLKSNEQILKDCPTVSTSGTVRAAIMDVVRRILAKRTGDFEPLKDTWRMVGRLSLALLDGNYMAFESFNGMLTANRNALKEERKKMLPKGSWKAIVDWTFDKTQDTVGLNLTAEQHELTKKNQKISVAHKNKNQVVIKAEAVHDLAFGLAKQVLAAKKPNLHANIISLQLAVGTRKLEILTPKISTFAIDPQNAENVIQTGVGKSMLTKANRELIDDDETGELEIEKRVIHKHVLGMTPPEFLELLSKTRAEIKERLRQNGQTFKTVTNAHLGNNYGKPVNDLVGQLFDKFGLPKGLPRSTHTLRKIHANYIYEIYAPKGESLSSFLTRYLGHSDLGISQATTHYTTIAIETDVALEKKASAELLENRLRIANADAEIGDLKKKVEELTSGAPITREVCIETGQSKLTQSTDDKFKLIDEAIAAGNGTYTKLQKLGFSAYMIAKHAKARRAAAEEAEAKADTPAANLRPKKKGKAAAPFEDIPHFTKGSTVAEALDWLLVHGYLASVRALTLLRPPNGSPALGFPDSKKLRVEHRAWATANGVKNGKKVN